MVRAVRGATTCEKDEPSCILEATRELLLEMVKVNGIDTEDLAGALFTVTPDLTSAFPARAARDLGWSSVPLLDAAAPAIVGSLQRCIRAMLFWNTQRSQDAIRHVYLRDATSLRPDIVAGRHTTGED